MRVSLMTAGVIFLHFSGLCFAQGSPAPTSRIETRIPPQALEDALKAFSNQDHVHVLYLTAIVRGLRTSGASGYLTADETMTRILRGTGLKYRRVGASAVSIFPGTSSADPPATRQDNRIAGPEKASRSFSHLFRLARAGIRPSSDALSPGDDKEISQDKQSKTREVALQEVTITGTRIPGIQPVGVPFQIITRTQIEDSGYTSLDQLLQSLPDDFRGGAAGASPDVGFTRGAYRGFNDTFGSGINLRGLGNNATLVLVDGHRVAPSGSGYYIDISTIPLSAVDHIEILTDGSSAVYGTDAIAGVVNIILKKQTSGVDTDIRYGRSQGGYSTYEGELNFGKEWDGGGYIVDTAYDGQSALDVGDRPFTSSIPGPTDIFPSLHQVWLSAAFRQGLGTRVSVHGDVEYSNTRRSDINSSALPAGKMEVGVPRWSGMVDASLRIPGSWTVDLALSGGEGVEEMMASEVQPGGPAQFSDGIREVSKVWQPSVEAAGGFLPVGGGLAKIALGMAYRSEGFGHVNYTSTTSTVYGDQRSMRSVYAELWIPFVSASNSVVGLEALTASGSVRRDRYSDFGATNNYKVGLSWYPVHQLQVRGAYSTSFRAPAVGEELLNSEQGTNYALLFPILSANGAQQVPVLILEGGRPHLRPETATNITFGLDWSPKWRNLRVSGNYYHIGYRNQLASAPFSVMALGDPALASVITQYQSSAPVEELVNSAIASGAQFFDYTGGLFGTSPLSQTDVVYDLRTQNLSRTDTRGFDMRATYGASMGSSVVSTVLDATYISKFITQLTPSSAPLEEVDTVGYPAHLRLMFQTAWTRGNVSVALTGNFVNRYPDTTSPVFRTIGSYTTFDLAAHYRFLEAETLLRGTTITLAAVNIFNRSPPYVFEGAFDIVGSHYDAANASPIGRLVSAEISKHW